MSGWRYNEPMRRAIAGLSDLNVFAIVANLLEGGFLYDTASQKAAAKIIAISRREQQRLLRLHDSGVARIKAGEATDAEDQP